MKSWKTFPLSLLLTSLLAVTGALWPWSSEATTLLVYNNNNNGAGSLRQAISDNAALGGGNTIVFSNIVTGTITLSSELAIGTNVTISGPGAKVLTVSGNNSSRVFNITSSTISVSISGLTIANGRSATNGGGGIFNLGVLTVSNCTFSGNNEVSGFGLSYGGGIFNSGTAIVAGCILSANNAINRGGGFYNAGTATVENCTFTNNSAERGGGIANVGTITLRNDTLSADVARSAALGGALFNAGSGTVSSCTVSGNSTQKGVVGMGLGGGIYVESGSLTVRDSIIAGNSADGVLPNGPDVFGTFISDGYNLIGDATGSSGWGALGDLVGTSNSPLNAMLGPLQDNGGPTPTMAPQPGSLTIDQGNSGGSTTDQRGRPRVADNPAIPNATGGDGSDIGAYEVNPPPLVTNANDNGAGSLRDAILLAASGDIINFASSVVGTITLTSGELLIDRNVTIVGPGAKVVTISGNNASRVFDITNGTVAISGLTIANGNAAEGAGIFHGVGSLALNNCAVTGNIATGSFTFGGGIHNGGTLTVSGCAISGNSGFWGGGIGGGAFVSIRNSTIASNTAVGTGIGGGGGGIWAGAGEILNISSSTIASNTCPSNSGGGIRNQSLATINVTNSIIAGNSASSGPDCASAVTSGGYNLIGNTSGSSGFTATGDQINVDPKLGPLADNGGPTFTHALKPGSPAIDKGISNGLTTDQRGAPRPFDFSSITNAGGGDGSDIGAFELGSPRLDIQRAAGKNVVVSWPSYYGDFTLESATNFSASSSWSAAGAPVIVGSQYNVTNSAAAGNKYFRLR